MICLLTYWSTSTPSHITFKNISFSLLNLFGITPSANGIRSNNLSKLLKIPNLRTGNPPFSMDFLPQSNEILAVKNLDPVKKKWPDLTSQCTEFGPTGANSMSCI